jgi:hypothetical protein
MIQFEGENTDGCLNVYSPFGRFIVVSKNDKQHNTYSQNFLGPVIFLESQKVGFEWL